MVDHNNWRTVCLVGYTITYLVIGAAVFEAIESPNEDSERLRLSDEETLFQLRYNISDEDFRAMTLTMVQSVPYKEGEMWHFSGSLYFAATVITTIGKFLMTTKATIIYIHGSSANLT